MVGSSINTVYVCIYIYILLNHYFKLSFPDILTKLRKEKEPGFGNTAGHDGNATLHLAIVFSG